MLRKKNKIGIMKYIIPSYIVHEARNFSIRYVFQHELETT